MTEVAPSAPAPVAKRPYGPNRVVDLVATILLLIANPVAVVLMVLLWLLLLFGGADSPNDTDRGQHLSNIAIPVAIGIAVVGTVVSIILLVRRRYAWWVALLTTVLVCVAGFGSLFYWNSLIE